MGFAKEIMKRRRNMKERNRAKRNKQKEQDERISSRVAGESSDDDQHDELGKYYDEQLSNGTRKDD